MDALRSRNRNRTRPRPRARRVALLPSSIAVLLAVFDAAAAQNIIPVGASATFPGCAVGCAVLQQAQTACIPPQVAATSQLTYENCFCQSGLLQALYSTPDAICAAECTVESDRTLLQTWFRNFCQQVGQGVDPLASATASPPVTVVTVTSYSTSPPAATGTGAGTGSASTSTSSSNQSWSVSRVLSHFLWLTPVRIAGHWQWILMVGILIIGLGLLTWLLVWLKRRHRRKVEERRATVAGFPTASEKRDGARSATPDLWGPHQHMHHTHGWEYNTEPSTLGSGALAASADSREKRTSRTGSRRKRRDRPDVAEVPRRPSATRGSSSKGKARARDDAARYDPEFGPASRSRSRS